MPGPPWGQGQYGNGECSRDLPFPAPRVVLARPQPAQEPARTSLVDRMSGMIAKGCDTVPAMDLRAWILDDLEGLGQRFDDAIAGHVPLDRWREQAGGGASIAALLFHTTWHADLALNVAVRDGAPLLETWRPALGLTGAAPHVGLGEAEDRALTARLDLEALRAYAAEVHAGSLTWLDDADLAVLDEVPPTSRRIEAAGVAEAEVPWLHRMWSAKPGAFFVQWEVVGHRQAHLGEMTSVRGRLGLSPF